VPVVGRLGSYDYGCENVSECGAKKILKNSKAGRQAASAKPLDSFGNVEG
jgi:hypothetical protein